VVVTGIGVAAPAGCDLDTFFFRCLGLDPDYAANRVRTVFLNGRPVDDTSRAALGPGDEVALSTAMSGLVGICMRRDSPIKSFRRDITHDPAAGTARTPGQGGTIPVTVRLFNSSRRRRGLAPGPWRVSGGRKAGPGIGGRRVHLGAALDGKACDAGFLSALPDRPGKSCFSRAAIAQEAGT
jgi:hypothetical protein